MVEGVLTIWIDGKRGDYGPGMRVAIPPRVPHRFKNFGKNPAVAEVTLDGPRMEDMFVPLAVAARARGLGPELPLSMMGIFLVMMVESRSSTPKSAAARAVIGGLAKMARLFGGKVLPPVQGWDNPN